MKTSRRQLEEEAREAARVARERKKLEEDVAKAIDTLVDLAMHARGRTDPEFRDQLRGEFATLTSEDAQKALVALAATLTTLRTEKSDLSQRYDAYQKGVRDATGGRVFPVFG